MQIEASKKRRHFFDLKIPLGGLIGFYGLVLFFYEFVRQSLYLDVNLTWGILMIAISAAFLIPAYRERVKR